MIKYRLEILDGDRPATDHDSLQAAVRSAEERLVMPSGSAWTEQWCRPGQPGCLEGVWDVVAGTPQALGVFATVAEVES